MIDIDEIPFRRKKALVRESCLMYKLIKNRIEKVKSVIENDDIEMTPMYIKVSLQETGRLSTFEMLFGLLNEHEKRIITNDFIINTHCEWWRKTWSKTTYYKLKHQAVDSFVGLLYS